MLALGRFWGCHEWLREVWGSAMWPGLVTGGGPPPPPASHPPKPSHDHTTPTQPASSPSSRPRSSQDFSLIRESAWVGGSGTVLSVWCLWRLTFISWCQAGTTEALWPWMSGHARHEPAVPFRQPTPTRAHDTPQCLCVVWATSPRTLPARRLLSGWVQGSRKRKIWRRWGDDCVGMMGLCRLAGAQLR